MWGTAKNGKAGSNGGWFVNYKIPFGKSVVVTVTGPIGNGFVIIRGCENLPVEVGAVTLPSTARMQLQRIENQVSPPPLFFERSPLVRNAFRLQSRAVATSRTRG